MHNHNHLGVHLKAAHEYVPPYNTPRRILCTDTFCLNVTVARFRNFRPNTHQQRQKCARRVIWPRKRCVCNVMRLNMRSKRSWYFCWAAVGNKFNIFLLLGWRRGGGEGCTITITSASTCRQRDDYVPPYHTPRRSLCTDTFCFNVTVARFWNFRPNTHQQRQKCARRVIWPRNRCVCNVMRLNMRSKRSWYFCLAALGNKI